MEETNRYVSRFANLENGARGNPLPPWLQEIRRDAISRFGELGFPTTRLEEWQYTNLSPLLGTHFMPSKYDLKGVSTDRLEEFSIGDLRCSQLVFVNGIFSKELSLLHRLPSGTRVVSLAEAFGDGGLLRPYLAKHADYQDHALVALNTAFIGDGALVFIPMGVLVKDPIHLLFVSTAAEELFVSHPRNLIIAGAGAQATVIESYAGLSSEVYLTNAVTEIVLGENATLRHIKVQRENDQAYHTATIQVQQGNNSTFSSNSISFGGALVRNDINVVLDGEGADCTLNGLYMVSGKQHVDNHTVIDHAKPKCTSRELYKGVLDDASSAVFNGQIIVRPDAQKTNARQTNKNLLLSERAVLNTKPQLEICADDVKCAHGATIGQLDENAMFYMRSRGIDAQTARKLLIHAFGGEITGALAIPSLQCQIDLIMHHRLSPVFGGKESV